MIFCFKMNFYENTNLTCFQKHSKRTFFQILSKLTIFQKISKLTIVQILSKLSIFQTFFQILSKLTFFAKTFKMNLCSKTLFRCPSYETVEELDVHLYANGESSLSTFSTTVFKFAEYDNAYLHAEVKICFADKETCPLQVRNSFSCICYLHKHTDNTSELCVYKNGGQNFTKVPVLTKRL